MLPADQRFGADHFARLKLHDRLVVDDELLAFDGAPQFRLQAESGYDGVVHRRFEDLESGLALRLGGVHRHVGVAQQLIGGVAVLADGDADAGADVDLLAQNPEGSPKGDSNSLRDAGRGGDVGVLEQDGELVAAEAGGRVLGAQRRSDSVGRLDQHVVAGGVAEAVVDRLEVVEVDEEHGRVRRGCAGRGCARPVRGRGCGWPAGSADRGRPGRSASARAPCAPAGRGCSGRRRSCRSRRCRCSRPSRPAASVPFGRRSRHSPLTRQPR